MSSMFVHRILPLALLLLLVSLTWWINIKVEPGIRQATQTQRHDPDYIMENFEAVSMNKQGTLEYRVNALKMTHYPDDDSTVLEQPHIIVYVDTVPSWQVKAERAEVSSEQAEIFLAGRVSADRLATTELTPATIVTSNLTIRRDAQLGETPDPVTITEEHGVTSATGMRIFLKDKRLELLSDVRGSYAAPK